MQAEAERLETGGGTGEAFEIYECLAKRYPGEGALLQKAAENAPRDKAGNGLMRLIEEHLSLHPADLDLLMTGARVLAEQAQTEKAAEYLRRLLLFVPDHSEARECLQNLTGGARQA